MAVLGSQFGKKLLGLGLGIGVGVVVMTPPAFAQNAPVQPAGGPGVIDPYAAQAAPAVPVPPSPPPVLISAPPVPVPPPTSNQSGNGNSNNVNTNTVDPVITASPVITANPTNTNTSSATNNANNTNTATNNANNTNDNKNDNRSNAAATATNNNTIYIYPPTYTPPPPVPAPVADRSSISPPPLLPPPMLPPYSADSQYYRPRRIRLNCQRLCATPPPFYTPIAPFQQKRPERFRAVSLGGHFTVMGMANQPLAGWGTLYGGGISLEFRSRGHFGFEMSQDFLRGSLGNVNGTNFERKSYPFEFTLKGYVMPNSDKHHFNMFFGGGFGVMPSSLDVPLGDATVAHQDFLEWMIHGDVGAELRFKWLSLGAEGRIDALYRDRSYGSGALYGDIKDAPVPSKTWGVEGRAFMKFWF